VSYDKKGELDAAIEQYRAVVALDAGYATAHTYLAIAYYKKGNYRMAIEHCDRAAALQGSVNELLLRVLAPYRNASP
jgi:tetratricopeptide (TPR) repeat protein